MQLSSPIILATNDYIPFTDSISNWAMAGPTHLISYDESSKHFNIPIASSNDYYISWYLLLKTATTPEKPIICLELLYNDVLRRDYIISPLRTLQIANTSLYHISNISNTDVLSIGLKVIGEENWEYTFGSNSTCNICANMMILGL